MTVELKLGLNSRECPEQMESGYSSVAACHMLWYLHLASKAGIVVTHYRDDPIGVGESTRMERAASCAPCSSHISSCSPPPTLIGLKPSTMKLRNSVSSPVRSISQSSMSPFSKLQTRLWFEELTGDFTRKLFTHRAWSLDEILP
jgi:hypothetical protein